MRQQLPTRPRVHVETTSYRPVPRRRDEPGLPYPTRPRPECGAVVRIATTVRTRPRNKGGAGGAASVHLASQAVPTTCCRHRGRFPTNLNRLECPACIAIASGREPEEASDGADSGAPAAGWTRIRAAVKRRDGYRCQRCGARMPSLTAHHIRPREHGEIDGFRNVVTLWIPCHNYVQPDEPAAG